jgi:hypothetical protein
MAKKRLNPKEVDQLLTQYRSERRRLMFQLETVREAIRGLKEVRGDNTEEGGAQNGLFGRVSGGCLPMEMRLIF